MWKTMRLDELFDFKNGRGFKKTEWRESGLPIIRIQNLNNVNAEFNYFEGDYDAAIEVNNGDLLFSWSGTVGTSFGAHIWEREKGVLNQHIFKLTKKKDIDTRYAFYCLKNITRLIEQSVVGAVGIRHVTKKNLIAFEILLPPLAEQQHIVTKLDAAFAEIDTAIAAADSKETEVEKLRASLLSASLSGVAVMWKTVKLRDICELNYGKALDKKDRVENGIIPAYGANGIKAFANKPLYDKPSIIIGRKGSAGEINKVIEPFWALDVTYYVTTDESIVDLDFLFFALTTLNLPSMARGVKPGINRNDVYDKSINLPPLAEQQRIVAKLDAAFANLGDAKDAVAKSKLNYQSLKSAILTQELQSETA